MYKFITGWEKDHERWEEVNGDEQCEDCGETNRRCQCTETADEAPVEKSFQQKYGFDERDGPPEEEEDEDDPDGGAWNEFGQRLR